MVVAVGSFFSGIIYHKRTQWTGFYYPNVDELDVGDRKTWSVSPPLKSLDECQRWVSAVSKPGDNSDYICSQGCHFTTEYIGETVICKNKIK